MVVAERYVFKSHAFPDALKVASVWGILYFWFKIKNLEYPVESDSHVLGAAPDGN